MLRLQVVGRPVVLGVAGRRAGRGPSGGSSCPPVRNWSARYGWVVPPMRRLISSAPSFQSSCAARSRQTRKSTAKRLTTPWLASTCADALARLLDGQRYSSCAGKLQPRKTWPLGPPRIWSWVEMERHLAARADAQLRARRVLLGRLDELLDDAAHARELVEVERRRLGGHRELEVLQPLARRRPRVGSSGIAEERVALAGEAVVELDHRARAAPAAALFSSSEGVLHLVLGAQVLHAQRQRRRPPRGTPCGCPTSCPGG